MDSIKYEATVLHGAIFRRVVGLDNIIDYFAGNFQDNPALICPNNCDCYKDCNRCLRTQYFEDSISYSCNNRRIMYVLKYLYVHSSEMYNLFRQYSNEIFLHLDSNNLLIRSIGAGPGSEIIGLLRYLISSDFEDHKLEDLYIQRVESEKGWDEIYTINMDLFEQSFPIPFYINITKKRIHRNVMIRPDFVKKCNILIFSYFWSEHLGGGNNLDIWDRLLSSLDKKSIVILNDRPENRVRRLFDTFHETIECNVKEFYEIDRSEHCGFHYDDDLKDKFAPKLNCNSHQRIFLLEK